MLVVGRRGPPRHRGRGSSRTVPWCRCSAGPAGSGSASLASALRLAPIAAADSRRLRSPFVVLRRGSAWSPAPARPADREHRLPYTANAGLRDPSGLAGAPPATAVLPASAPTATPPPPAQPPPAPDLYREATERVGQLPGVDGVSGSSSCPARHRQMGPLRVTVEGYMPANGEENPYARSRSCCRLLRDARHPARCWSRVQRGRSPRQGTRRHRQPEIVERPFPTATPSIATDVLGRRTSRASPALPARIVGIVADVDDESVERAPAMALDSLIRGKCLPCECSCGHPRPACACTGGNADHPRRVGERGRSIAGYLEDVRAEGSDTAASPRFRGDRLRGYRAVDCRGRRRGRAGVRRQRAHPRVRRAAGHRIDAAPLAGRVLPEGAAIVAIGIVGARRAAMWSQAAPASYFENVEMPGAAAARRRGTWSWLVRRSLRR